MKHLCIYIILSFTLLSCGSSYQVIHLEDLDSPWVKQPLNLKFEPHNAMPLDGGIVSLSGGYYSLEIIGDTVNFLLPYYGRAFQLDFNDTGYTIENGQLSNLRIKQNTRKESNVLMFDVLKQGKTYSFQLEFWDNGTAYLDLSSLNRNKISYDGNLEKL